MGNILKKNLASYDALFQWSVNFRWANSVSAVLNLVFAIFSKTIKVKMKNLLPRDDRKCNEEHFEKKFDLLRYFLSLKRKFSLKRKGSTTWKLPTSPLRACALLYSLGILLVTQSIFVVQQWAQAEIEASDLLYYFAHKNFSFWFHFWYGPRPRAAVSRLGSPLIIFGFKMLLNIWISRAKSWPESITVYLLVPLDLGDKSYKTVWRDTYPPLADLFYGCGSSIIPGGN